MIPDIIPVNTWSGNGSSKTFEFDFLINDISELVVYHIDSNGVQTQLKYNIDYSIDTVKNSEGSFITFPLESSDYNILGENEKISLILQLPIAQTFPFGTSQKLNLYSLEFALDYIVRLIQIISRKTDRSAKIPEGTNLLDVNFPYPEANNVIQWDDKGEKLINYNIDGKIQNFTQNTELNISNFKNDINNKFEKLTSDTNQSINNNKQELEKDIQDFKQEVNSTIKQVNEAADKINKLDEDIKKVNDVADLVEENVEKVKQSAEEANKSAEAAAQSANEAIKELSNKADIDFSNITETAKDMFAIKPYSKDYTFKKNDKIIYTKEDETLSLARSLQNDNQGHNPETETTWWEDLPLGSNTSGYTLFDIVQKDHKLTYEEKEGLELLGEYVYKEVADGRYGYPDFYAKCLEEYNEGIDNTEEIEGITIKINSNRHKFYDIKDKEKIDEIYETTGVAWYYGIDEKNKRILLPRNKSFFQAAESSEVGNSVEAGVPNITGNNIWGGGTLDPSGSFHYTGANSNLSCNLSSARNIGYTDFDASRSNSIYGKSTTVQPPAVKTLIYMVVGNTTVTQAQTEVTEVAASENDTIPLFTGMYFDFNPNHVSWLKAGTEASGKIYQSAYNELLKISKGEETKYGEGFKVIKETAKLPDTDYSEYWIVNEEEQTFRTPFTVEQITKSESTNLYFKVANAVENLEVIDAGEVMEALNNAVNKTECKSYVIDTYTNEDSGYRVYSDGYCEQWGEVHLPGNIWVPVNLYKNYSDNNYNISGTLLVPNSFGRTLSAVYVDNDNKTSSSFNFRVYGESPGALWKTSGYLPEGSY